MPNQPWGASPPELNSGVIETGSTQATWMAASAAWMGLAEAAMTAMAITGTQMVASTTSMSGIRSMTHEAATPPFLSWLAAMAGIAFKQSAVAGVVAESYTMTRSSMIPSVQSITNRLNEHAAEATNIFGQNTPLIGELNAEYGEYTAQNATLGSTYGEVITAATLPTPIPPPPPLGNLARAAGEAASSMSDAASQLGQSGQGLSQAASQTASQVSSKGTSGMGEMSSMFQAPLQAAQSAGQSFSSVPQSFSQLLQAPSQMFGSFSSMGGLLGGGSTGDSFSPALAGATGGLPLGGGSGLHGGAGLGMGGGGGLGGGLSNLAKSGESGSSSRSSVLSGIQPVQEKTVTTTSGGGGTPRGGMMPHAGQHAGSSSKSRREESVLSATPAAAVTACRREAQGNERELFN